MKNKKILRLKQPSLASLLCAQATRDYGLMRRNMEEFGVMEVVKKKKNKKSLTKNTT